MSGTDGCVRCFPEMPGNVGRGVLGAKNVRHLGFSSPEIPPGKKTITICMKLTQMAFPTSESYILPL